MDTPDIVAVVKKIEEDCCDYAPRIAPCKVGIILFRTGSYIFPSGLH